MKKPIPIILSTILILITVASALVLFTGVISHFTTTVNPAEITFVAIESSVPSLNSLSTFTTDAYDPAGSEISIANIEITNAYIHATDLSLSERDAFTELDCHINIYNSTYTLVNSSFSPLLDQHLYISQPLAGDWDVAIQYSGTTAMPEIAVPISFNVIINLTQDISVCTQWFGVSYQSAEEHCPVENATVNVSDQQCTTNSGGYCTLDLYDHAAYTATATHPDHTTQPTVPFTACGDATGNIGYPLSLRF